jgi:hypothetical protein
VISILTVVPKGTERMTVGSRKRNTGNIVKDDPDRILRKKSLDYWRWGGRSRGKR